MQCKRMAYVVNNSSIKTIGFSPRDNEWQAIIQFVDGSTWCGSVEVSIKEALLSLNNYLESRIRKEISVLQSVLEEKEIFDEPKEE